MGVVWYDNYFDKIGYSSWEELEGELEWHC